MSRKIVIKSCSGCPNRDHSGGFTQGGAIPLCRGVGGNGTVVSGVARGGGGWPDRYSSVLPFNAEINERGFPERVATEVIPDWCPLPRNRVWLP